MERSLKQFMQSDENKLRILELNQNLERFRKKLEAAGLESPSFPQLLGRPL
jgi:hypothetical protein